MEVFAFIDTNVLLHYRFFRDVDWAAALDEPEVVLVLAPVVLSELDDHKWSGVKGGVNLDHFGGAKVDQLVKG